jgi:putative peptide maturation system protein
MNTIRQSALEEALPAVLSLLTVLPQDEGGRRSAIAEIGRLAARWPELGIDAAVFPDPVRHTVDYDVLFHHPNGGTVALSYAPDDGVPWVLRFAESVEAYKIAKVNEEYITFQTGLLALQLDPQARDLFERMVTAAILGQVVEREKIQASSAETQEAMDQFRRAHGLREASATHKWLQERGFDRGDFERLMLRVVSARKLRAHVIAGKTEEYFEDHRAAFDRVTITHVTVSLKQLAEDLAAEAGDHDDLLVCARRRQAAGPSDVEAMLHCRWRRDLPCEVSAMLTRDSLVGVIGPLRITGPLDLTTGYDLFQVTAVRPAELDPKTRSAVEEAIFQEWLARERANAHVEWYLT